jgi:protein-L-isoaspartate(D-aspartate) O-methyltransferase
MSFEDARRRMVERQLAGRGIADPRVLDALGRVPRHRFVAAHLQDEAYGDHPLPIGRGQTVSQPYMVARMSELCALEGDERVLEIGAGSGYQTAILCELCREVFAIEIIHELAAQTRARLADLGYRNVVLESFDGTLGWPEAGPFQAILVAAGAPTVPVLLLYQLAERGRLIIPVGDRGEQRLQRVTRYGDQFETLWDTPCRFVDLVGRYGWGGEGPAAA